jgi:triosephosphate isomerase
MGSSEVLQGTSLSVRLRSKICPPALSLTTAVEATIETNVAIGAQKLYPGKEDAFTGEISGRMIKSAGCTHALIGH